MENGKIIYAVVICGILGAVSGLLIPAVMSERNLPGFRQGETYTIQENKSLLSTDLARLISSRENICEECHLSGKVTAPQADRIKKHVDGGKYCLNCHAISHEKHPVEGNVTCQDCHGSTNPKVPVPGDASPACNKCHAYPDALSPGGGLIAIHQPRGVNCVSCHIDCMNCHEQAVSGKKWDKRLKHFNSLPDTYK